MTVADKTFIENLREELTDTKVLVYCKTGILPLEWPRDENGDKKVSDAEVLVTASGKIMRRNEKIYRNIETRITDENGVGAQSDGFMELDTSDTSHPFETDAEFLARIEDWLANSNDYRIEKYGVHIRRGQPFPQPFDRWDELSAASIGEMVALMLGDDHEENLVRLKRYAGYELNRRDASGGELEPRQDVLDVLEYLASASGDEAEDAPPIDETDA